MHATPVVHVRRFEPDDRDAVVPLGPRLMIGVAEWRDSEKVLTAVQHWIESSLASAGADGHAVFVAELDSRIVGVVTVGERRHFTGETDGYVGELVTAADAEGRGIARELMVAAEEWTRQRGHTRLTLETGAHNHRAREFYRRAGYEEEEVRLARRLPATDGGHSCGS